MFAIAIDTFMNQTAIAQIRKSHTKLKCRKLIDYPSQINNYEHEPKYNAAMWQEINPYQVVLLVIDLAHNPY